MDDSNHTLKQSNSDNKKVSWSDLSTEQKNAVLSLTLSKNPTQAAKMFKSITKRSLSYFWGNVYPTIKDQWQNLSLGLPDSALRILRGGSIAAAYELVDEIKNRDVRIRNKASNDILDKLLPDKPQMMQQINVGSSDKEKNSIVFINFNGTESK